MTGYRAHTANTSTRAHDERGPRPACRDHPDLHYPIGAGPQHAAQTAAAKAVCAACPIRETCLQYALDHRERFGIWGGLDETERALLLAEWEAPEPPPLIDRIRDLAGRGLSDPQIADRLADADLTSRQVQTLRLTAGERIPAGRNPAPFRTEGAA